MAGRRLSLAARAWLSVAVMALVMAATLFGAAGTVDYWEAWLYLIVFVGASAVATATLLRHDPALLERRMRGGPAAEKERSQRVIMLFASAGFVALLVVPALDRRFRWSAVPVWLVLAGDLLVAIGFVLILRVYRENSFAAATIEVESGQSLISTGPYAIVRHPMYASALLYLLGTPLALGSLWGLAAFAAMVPVLIWRLRDEERVLQRDLPGYAAYRERVRHRLLPGLW